MTSTIGFVGLGIMGLGMVKNLVTKLGVNLVVWNRGTAVCDEVSRLYPGKVKDSTTQYLLILDEKQSIIAHFDYESNSIM